MSRVSEEDSTTDSLDLQFEGDKSPSVPDKEDERGYATLTVC